ncbi:MAG: GNAT family N-acetyltransferase [Chloroflexi bacterium]|nr:GNAT family N-acetyltransferase [Chloroflexota bacterium]
MAVPMITFERATPADAETLRDVQVASFHSDALNYPGIKESGPPGYDQVETVLRNMQESDFYKIAVDGQIIGGITVFDEGEGHYHIGLLYLDPAYHNLGIGTRAMEFIEQSYPARLWTLDTPTYATRNQHFYEKFGYVRVGERPEDEDITLIEYEKRMP